MEYAAIKAAVEALNATGKCEKIKTVAVKAEDVKAKFVAACSGIPLEDFLTLDKNIILAFVYTVGAYSDEEYAAQTAEVKAIYDNLPDEYFAAPEPVAPAEGAAPAAPKEPKAPKAPKVPGDKGYKSDCADFGKKCDDTSTLCQTCKTSKNDEYVVCSEKTQAKKDKKAPTAPARPKNVLGHVIGSMSGDIDDHLLAGPCYADVIIADLMAKHEGKDAKACHGKLKSHLSWIVNREGHKVDVVVEGEGEAKRTLITFTQKVAAA